MSVPGGEVPYIIIIIILICNTIISVIVLLIIKCKSYTFLRFQRVSLEMNFREGVEKTLGVQMDFKMGWSNACRLAGGLV